MSSPRANRLKGNWEAPRGLWEFGEAVLYIMDACSQSFPFFVDNMKYNFQTGPLYNMAGSLFLLNELNRT